MNPALHSLQVTLPSRDIPQSAHYASAIEQSGLQTFFPSEFGAIIEVFWQLVHSISL